MLYIAYTVHMDSNPISYDYFYGHDKNYIYMTSVTISFLLILDQSQAQR